MWTDPDFVISKNIFLTLRQLMPGRDKESRFLPIAQKPHTKDLNFTRREFSLSRALDSSPKP